MPLADKVQQLDEQITSAVKSKLASLRQELNERLRQNTEAIRERLEGLETGLPASFVGDHDLEPIASEAAAGARSLALSDLNRALAALDRASSQAAVLATLLEHAGAHASRAALFLTPAEAARGWRGEGFADAGAIIPGLTIPYSAGTAWGALAEGRGTVALSPADCADMASRLESPIPREAVLIPLVLADRIAAALYADRSDDRALEASALQALVHFAAQAIELLPLRTRHTTPTFQAPGAAEGAGLPLWAAPIGGQAAEAAPAAEAPAPAESAPPVEVAEAAEPVPEETPIETEAPWSAPSWAAPSLADTPEPPPAVEAAEEEVAADLAAPLEPEEPAGPFTAEPASFFTPEVAPPEAGPDPLAIASWEETAAEFFPTVPVEEEAPAADLSSPAATATLPAFTAEESAPLPWPEPAAVEEIEEYELPPVEEVAGAPEQEWPGEEWAQESEPLGDETAVESPAAAAAAYTGPSFEPPAFEPPPFVAPEPPAAVEPSTATLDMPSLDLADDETILLSRQSATVAISMPPPVAPSAPPEPAPAEEPEEEATHPGRVPFATTRFTPTPSEAAGAVVPPPIVPQPLVSGAGPGGTAVVRPPSGFEGPGLAFAAGPRAVPGTGETAAHEEARRLARLLVSEIRLYNEEQVEEGRRNRDIYFRLRDEIDRSRKMYDERIAPEVRSANDYFTEELIRRLADGDPDALGM